MEIISSAVAGGGERLSSQNLRDLLRIKDEYHHHNLNQSTSSNGGGGGNNPSGLTLEAVLRDKRGPPSPEVADEPLQRVQSNRTLLDIIREDQTSGFGGRGRSRRSWRHLKDKIRLPRRGAAYSSSSVRIPVSDVPLNNNHQIHRASARFNSNTNSSESTQHDIPGDLDTNSSRLGPTSSLPGRLISEDNHRIILDEDEQHGVDDTVETGEQPVRMSLMALLAENDRQMGFEGSAYTMDEDQEGEDQDEETMITTDGAAAVHGGEYNNCCVCMVRHKGAAFIPCGHTFCRLCSRELWVKRGNCPLCNNYISEILDIF